MLNWGNPTQLSLKLLVIEYVQPDQCQAVHYQKLLPDYTLLNPTQTWLWVIAKDSNSSLKTEHQPAPLIWTVLTMGNMNCNHAHVVQSRVWCNACVHVQWFLNVVTVPVILPTFTIVQQNELHICTVSPSLNTPLPSDKIISNCLMSTWCLGSFSENIIAAVCIIYGYDLTSDELATSKDKMITLLSHPMILQFI